MKVLKTKFNMTRCKPIIRQYQSREAKRGKNNNKHRQQSVQCWTQPSFLRKKEIITYFALARQINKIIKNNEILMSDRLIYFLSLFTDLSHNLLKIVAFLILQQICLEIIFIYQKKKPYILSNTYLGNQSFINICCKYILD